MWMLLMMVCLLDQNQAASLPWEQSSPQPFLQQVGQSTASPAPDVAQQKTSSSSSSSSSSVSSESSQSSEEPQQLREQPGMEDTAVEQMDSSQESSELLLSSNVTSLLLNELVLLGERAGERDGERDTGDDSVEGRESRHQAPLLTFHRLQSAPRLSGPELGVAAGEAAAGLGGATITGVGGAEGDVAGEEGGVREDERDAEFNRLLDDSTEKADGLTLDSPGHAHHLKNEAGLELGL